MPSPFRQSCSRCLDQILCHPELTNLKGIALEVDTKPVELIVDEFAEFSRRYGPLFRRPSYTEQAELDFEIRSLPEGQNAIPDVHILQAAYDRYARVLAGKTEPVGAESSLDMADIQIWIFIASSISRMNSSLGRKGGGHVCRILSSSQRA